jgi:hypothetical protein
MIQVRGIRISDEEASELARGLRNYGDPVGIGVAERIERGLLLGTAIIGASRPEAAILLNVIEAHWACRCDATPRDRERSVQRSHDRERVLERKVSFEAIGDGVSLPDERGTAKSWAAAMAAPVHSNVEDLVIPEDPQPLHAVDALRRDLRVRRAEDFPEQKH